LNSIEVPNIVTERERAPVFRAGGLLYRRAELQDEADVRAAFRENPMDGWVRLAFERAPGFSRNENRDPGSGTFVARETDGGLVGTYALETLRVHVDGRPETVGYLAGLRVRREYRHKVRVLKGGFASLATLAPASGTVPCYFTSIAQDNRRARRFLEARLPGMPVYQAEGEMETFVFRAAGRRHGILHPAQPRDIPALARFYNAQAARYQFAPVLSERMLNELNGARGLNLSDFLLIKDGPTLRGCLALWDQRSYRQTVVKGYRFPLNVLRPISNAWSALRGGPALPAPGQSVEQVFLAFAALDLLPTDVAERAIQEALSLAKERGAGVGILGLSPSHPLARSRFIRRHSRVYRTVIETVTWPDAPRPRLTSLQVQPEIALL
jgi:hypothetical protein